MKFKMRVVHQTGATNASAIAQAISMDQKTTTDSIPVSYPIKNERLLFVGAESKGSSPDSSLVTFCKNLSVDRVKNVAFFDITAGKGTNVGALKTILEAQGIKVLDDVFECSAKGGLFKKGAVSDEDTTKAVAWANKIVDSLADPA